MSSRWLALTALVFLSSPAISEPSQSVSWKEKDAEFSYVKVQKYVNGVPTWLEILEISTASATTTWRSREPNKVETCVIIVRQDARVRLCHDLDIRDNASEGFGKIVHDGLAHARAILQK